MSEDHENKEESPSQSEVTEVETKTPEETLRNEGKKFSANVFTSSVRKQRELYDNLIRVLDRVPDLPEIYIKTFVRLSVTAAVERYNQPKSFQYVDKLLSALAKHDHPATVRHLAQTIVSAMPTLPNLTECIALVCVPTSKWLTKLVAKSYSDEDVNHIISALGVLAFYAVTSKTASRVFAKKFGQMLKVVSVEKLTPAVIRYCEEATNGEKAIALVSFIDKITESTALTAKFADFYSKYILLAKSRPREKILVNAQYSLKKIDSDIFKTQVFSNIKKSLLRSPEFALYGIDALLKNVQFPLDEFADDIFKSAQACFANQDEDVRTMAINVVVDLATHSQAPVIGKLINQLFTQVSGAKSPEHRVSILNGIALCAKTDVSSGEALDVVANDIISKTAKSASESHVRTVAANWKCAVEWSKRLSKETPQLTTAFKEAVKVPVATRYLAYRALSEIVSARCMEKLPEGTEKTLWAELDNSQKEVLETICLGSLLMQTAVEGSEDHAKLWKKLVSNENMFKDKSLNAITNEEALQWATLQEKLILTRPADDESYPSIGVRSLSLLLFWPHYAVRNRAFVVLGRILAIEESRFAETLAESIYRDTVNGFIDQCLSKVAGGAHHSAEWKVPGEWYVKVVHQMLTPTGPSLGSLSIHTLLVSCLPRLVEVDGAVWLRWMHEQQHNEADWVNTTEFREHVIEKVLRCKERHIRDTALIALVVLNEPTVKAELWKHVYNNLIEIDTYEYTKIQEKNVAIFRTPEGTLHNTDVLEIDEGGGGRNVKRENKAYSYEEQQAEIELRRELAAKMRREGKLTPKQKQAMEKELSKEKEIRDELRELYNTAETCLDEASAMVLADHQGAFSRPDLLFDKCLPLTKSYLVGTEAAKLFLAYRDAAFEASDDYLHELVGHSTLRLCGSKWTDNIWSSEPLPDALKRALSLLNERAFVMDDDADEDSNCYGYTVGPSEIMLLFPLLRAVIEGNHSDALKDSALQFAKSAINKKFLKDGSVLQLPIVQYANLFLKFSTETEDQTLKKSSVQALNNLVFLVNDTGISTDRVVKMVNDILNNLSNPDAETRENVLRVLSANQLITRLVTSNPDSDFVPYCLVRIFIARFDGVEAVSSLATDLWLSSLIHLNKNMLPGLVDECVSPQAFVRDSAADALADFIGEFPDEMRNAIDNVQKVYLDLYDIKGVLIDDMGRMQRDAVDEWPRRKGAGTALLKLSAIVEEADAERLIHVVVPQGLDDRTAPVRYVMTESAVETIRRHGAATMGTLLPFLENLLDKTPDTQAHDNLRQGLVVLMGTLAQYIDPSSAKVRAIVERLKVALSTPSQTVQESVSKCLAPLVPSIKDGAKDLIGNLQNTLMETDSYGERRGAAYGIAGLVKGMGMLSLKELNLLPTVMKSLQDKKNAKHREGALLALEILCSTIGRLFEPYMIKALPLLLSNFGDNNENIRKAAEDTSRAMMAALSAHGTKLVLPSLLNALDDDAWRTKCAATELLGSMAYCAPKQLSQCLPRIVPKLIEVLADSHSKVTISGQKALSEIAKVIRNPEILGVVNHIMQGLIDPATKTSSSLQSILNTKFIHYIDAPSLALIMPIVRRAFEDRNSETRRFAAQIISNIYNLCEHKDMEPYLTQLVPGLQKSLMDPVPDIRAVAAKALGAIISKSEGTTSERLREEIIPWLKENLINPASTVDRSGAAQGLAEVLGGVGTEQLDYVMPEIIAATESTDVSPETRDGYILMYIYLPMVFGERFVPYLPQVVPPILKALADENEYVRASALKAGQRLIAQYCSHARRLLLPQLQSALFDDNWRIRHAAVQLLGDFLFNISGVSGKSTSATADEDDTMGMEQAGKQIIRALGQKCRDEVLSGLYLTRSDVALLVRQASNHVWKMVVSNTPRTVKEVMKTLFEMVVECLASSCEERQQMGARCLGELVRKMGEKILNEILPILEQNQKSEDISKRIGVAVALNEIIDNVSKEVLNHYLQQVVVPIKNALIDEEPTVREQAATTFSKFYSNVGNDALDEIISPLLESLEPGQHAVLDGLCSVMKLNSKHMLPYLLPRLTRPPINVHALCSLAAVAGDSLSRQLPKVLDSLIESCKTNDQYDPMIDPCEKVVCAVTDEEEGVPLLLEYLVAKATKDNVPSAVLLHRFIEKTQVPLNEHLETIIPGMIQLYTSQFPQIVDHAINALIALLKPMDQREQQDVIPVVKKQLNYMIAQAKGKPIPGFAHPKALQPLIPMLREGILQGGVEIKELSGETLGQVVSISDPVAIKSHVVNVTGPLIRVLGDRYPANVKLAILSTLSQLLDKVDAMMRPFLPQLQSIFVKALQEPSSRTVRLAAGGALRRLLKIHPKPEPLVAELWKTLAAQQDQALMETTFIAARALVGQCAAKLSEGAVDEGFRVCALAYKTTLETPTELDNSMTIVSGALLGELAMRTGQIDKHDIFKDIENGGKSRAVVAKAYALQQMCMSDAEKVWANHEDIVRSTIQGALSSEANVAQAALKAAGYILISQGESPNRELLALVVKAINHQSVDVRRIVSVVIGHVAHEQKEIFGADVLKSIVPSLVNGTKESNTGVRCAAETALIQLFKLFANKEAFDTYISTEKGAAKDGLIDCYDRTLKRLVKHNDYALEAMNNIISVP